MDKAETWSPGNYATSSFLCLSSPKGTRIHGLRNWSTLAVTNTCFGTQKNIRTMHPREQFIKYESKALTSNQQPPSDLWNAPTSKNKNSTPPWEFCMTCLGWLSNELGDHNFFGSLHLHFSTPDTQNRGTVDKGSFGVMRLPSCQIISANDPPLPVKRLNQVYLAYHLNTW